MTIEFVFTAAAVITALGVVIGAAVAVYRLARRIDDAIGVDAKGRSLSERLERVEHQLWPNGGSSLADRVNELCNQGAATSAQLVIIRDMLAALAGGAATPQEPTATPIKRRKKAS